MKNTICITFLLLYMGLVRADNCPICLKELHGSEVVQELCCGHDYHAECLGRGMVHINICSLCRQKLSLHNSQSREHEECVEIQPRETEETEPVYSLTLTRTEMQGVLQFMRMARQLEINENMTPHQRQLLLLIRQAYQQLPPQALQLGQ